MNFRYYVKLASGRWNEVSYRFWIKYDGEKKRTVLGIPI